MAFSSDLDQITRAAAGERQAVSALVNRYSPGVLALATRMLADRAEAEDVTQETFIRAWKALPTWEPRAKFSTWLHRVALNLCYDRLRKRRESTVAELPDQVDMALRPDDALDQSERVRAVESAIALLAEAPDRFSAELQAARDVDALLGGLPDEMPSAALTAALIDAAPKARPQRRSWLAAIPRWPTVGALASLAIGLAIGLGTAQSGTTATTEDSVDTLVYAALGFDVLNYSQETAQ